VMSTGWLPEREKLCRLTSPRAFPPEIWWVGVRRNKASRTRVGLPILKVEGAASQVVGNLIEVAALH